MRASTSASTCIATAIRGGLTAPDLADLELAYAPPYGSAKDPVNIVGYVAGNRLAGTEEAAQWHEVADLVTAGAAVVDVRSPKEYAAGSIPGAVNIPLDELRQRMAELPDGDLVVHCQSGQRSHTAASLIRPGRAGRVLNLDGGYRTWRAGTGG